MRGTGKTHISKRIYALMMGVEENAVGYIIDSNAAGDFTGWQGAYDDIDVPIIKPGDNGRQIVWQPPYDNSDMYEDFFDRLFYSSMRWKIPAVVFIDELSCLGKGEHTNYARLLKRGRKRTGFPGITVISLSQEFAQRAQVPRQTFSQMNLFLRFYVQHPYDVQESNRLLHVPPHVQPEHEHGFWAIRFDKPPVKPVYYRGAEMLGL
jgi:hypothetical protein